MTQKQVVQSKTMTRGPGPALSEIPFGLDPIQRRMAAAGCKFLRESVIPTMEGSTFKLRATALARVPGWSLLAKYAVVRFVPFHGSGGDRTYAINIDRLARMEKVCAPPCAEGRAPSPLEVDLLKTSEPPAPGAMDRAAASVERTAAAQAESVVASAEAAAVPYAMPITGVLARAEVAEELVGVSLRAGRYEAAEGASQGVRADYFAVHLGGKLARRAAAHLWSNAPGGVPADPKDIRVSVVAVRNGDVTEVVIRRNVGGYLLSPQHGLLASRSLGAVGVTGKSLDRVLPRGAQPDVFKGEVVFGFLGDAPVVAVRRPGPDAPWPLVGGAPGAAGIPKIRRAELDIVSTAGRRKARGPMVYPRLAPVEAPKATPIAALPPAKPPRTTAPRRPTPNVGVERVPEPAPGAPAGPLSVSEGGFVLVGRSAFVLTGDATMVVENPENGEVRLRRATPAEEEMLVRLGVPV